MSTEKTWGQFYKENKGIYSSGHFTDRTDADGVIANEYQIVYRETILKHSGNDKVALELGCGNKPIFEMLNRFASISYTDISSEALEAAKKQFDERENIESEVIFKEMNVEKFDFADTSLDIVFNTRAPHRENTSTELMRTLKPGGVYVYQTIGEEDFMDFKLLLKGGRFYDDYLAKKLTRYEVVKKSLVDAGFRPENVNLVFDKKFKNFYETNESFKQKLWLLVGGVILNLLKCINLLMSTFQLICKMERFLLKTIESFWRLKNKSMKEPDFTSPEQERSLKQELKAYIEHELTASLSPERKGELTNELHLVTNLFEQAQIPYCIAGGTGIDLLDGEWDRDHQDLDIAILSSDKEIFLEDVLARGIRFTDAERNHLSLEELSEPRENAFAYGELDGTFIQFEIMFRDDAADLAHTVSVTVEEKELVLQAPEVIAFHKVMGGRRKDLADVLALVSQLDEARLQRLNDMLHSAGRTTIHELLQEGKALSKELSEIFFTTNPQAFLELVEAEFLEVIKALYEERNEAQSQQDYFEKLSERYGGFLPERKKIVQKIADYLFQDPKPAFKEFEKFSRSLVDMNERLKQKALYEYQSEKIWKVE